MYYPTRFIAVATVATFLSGCASLEQAAQKQVATVGPTQIVVDANGNEIPLPASLTQSVYANEDRDYGVPVSAAVNTGPSIAPTPVTHPTAQVQYTPAAYSSFRSGEAIFVYVGESYDPEGKTAIVPGSLWWPSAGAATSATKDRLLTEVAAATGGDPTIPIIFYCDRPDCWGPYNAALQLQGSPYQNVSWYRGGTSAWYEAGLPLEIALFPDWT